MTLTRNWCGLSVPAMYHETPEFFFRVRVLEERPLAHVAVALRVCPAERARGGAPQHEPVGLARLEHNGHIGRQRRGRGAVGPAGSRAGTMNVASAGPLGSLPARSCATTSGLSVARPTRTSIVSSRTGLGVENDGAAHRMSGFAVPRIVMPRIGSPRLSISTSACAAAAMIPRAMTDETTVKLVRACKPPLVMTYPAPPPLSLRVERADDAR